MFCDSLKTRIHRSLSFNLVLPLPASKAIGFLKCDNYVICCDEPLFNSGMSFLSNTNRFGAYTRIKRPEGLPGDRETFNCGSDG
jgi:hypothetical protein